MQRKNYVALSIQLKILEFDIITTSIASDGVRDDRLSVLETGWLD